MASPTAIPGRPAEDRQFLAGERSIAGRLDRLPTGFQHYVLAGIAQFAWGVVIGADLLIARLYPFIWAPHKLITSFQYDVLVVANTGVGLLVGEYVLGGLGDRIGRKKVLILGAFITGAFVWPIAFTNKFGWLLLWNFLYALGMGAVISQSQSYMSEVLPPATRAKIGLGGQIMALGVAGTLAAVPAYFWVPAQYQNVVFVLAFAPIVLLIPALLFLIPESPRWLESKGRYQEADAIVSGWEARIERQRGALPPVEAEYRVVIEEGVPLGELYRGRYGKRTILNLVVWITAYAAMIYGFAFEAPVFLVGNRHFTAHELFGYGLLGTAASCLALIVASFVGDRIDRKFLVVIGAAIFGVSAIILWAGHGLALSAIFYIFTFVGPSFFFMNMYQYTAASYPTRIRAAGIGATDGLGHIGSVASPLIAGPLFTATVASSAYGWWLWCIVIGAAIPIGAMVLYAERHRDMALEELSE